MMQETSAPITLDELVPTIVESLGKDYSEFGSSIHDFNDGEPVSYTHLQSKYSVPFSMY